MRYLVAFVSGLLFAVGLVLGGMTQPAVVVGFLDFFGRWNPALMGVMMGAIAVYAPVFWLVTRRRSRPFFDDEFHLPTRRIIDTRLVAGAMIFGAGWGMAGYCPGPGLTSLAAGTHAAALFVVGLTVSVAGFRLAQRAARARLASSAQVHSS